MNKWITYLKERSPIAALLVIGFGVSLSGQSLLLVKDYPAMVIGTLVLVAVLILLRLMDEIKDYEKDRVAHPTRPLPRGLVSIKDLEKAINVVMSALYLVAVVLYASGHRMGGLLTGLTTMYAWLMYREFYIGSKLADYPMVYAITHQVIIFPLYAIPLALASENMFMTAPFIFYMTYNLGASMTFEIARKLDPKALPILKTYLSIYGRNKTAFILLCCIGCSIWASFTAQLYFLVGCESAVALSLILMFAKPEKFKAIEGLAVLSSLVHVYALAIQGWLK